jgi:uncharacterized membrane protein
MTWVTSAPTLTAFWIAGMLAYAAAFYHSDVQPRPGHPGFVSWITTLGVLSTKILGFAVMGVWVHDWNNPALKWLENIMPHRPFAAFVFGFFCDVIALQARKLIRQKIGLDWPGPGAPPA